MKQDSNGKTGYKPQFAVTVIPERRMIQVIDTTDMLITTYHSATLDKDLQYIAGPAAGEMVVLKAALRIYHNYQKGPRFVLTPEAFEKESDGLWVPHEKRLNIKEKFGHLNREKIASLLERGSKWYDIQPYDPRLTPEICNAFIDEWSKHGNTMRSLDTVSATIIKKMGL